MYESHFARGDHGQGRGVFKRGEEVAWYLEVVDKLADSDVDLLEKHVMGYRRSFNLTKEEVCQKYEECNILIIDSTYEGFGMPIVEANVVVRPFIILNILPIPEVAGDAAFLIDPFSGRHQDRFQENYQ